jgi:hypothetical protein
LQKLGAGGCLKTTTIQWFGRFLNPNSGFFSVTLTDELLRLVHERQATLTDIKRWMGNAFQRALIDDQTR